MRPLQKTQLVAALAVTFGLGMPVPVLAIPAFARKYGLACTACHEAWPKLNDFGRAFRDRGYRLDGGVDDPKSLPPAYWPMSLRTTPGYSYASLSNQPTDQGKRTIGSGTFVHPEADLLTGGTLGRNVSFLAIVAGFGEEGTAAIEAAFVRINDLGQSPWLNLKLGKHEIDLPRAGHRSLSLTQGYLVYSHHSGGEANGLAFDMAENQLGVELSGHDKGSRTRYTVSLVSANGAPGNDGVLSSPTLYGHVTHRFNPTPRGLTQVRVGAFGLRGWSPSQFLTNGEQPIPGTGTANKTFSRIGGELGLWLGPLANPVALTAVFAHGSENKGLFDKGEGDAKWNGGFVQAEWTPRLSLTVFGRYDWIRNTQQPLADFEKSFGDEDACTAGLRYTFDFSSRNAVAWHAEFTSRRTRQIGVDGLNVTAKQFFTGLDFAF